MEYYSTRGGKRIMQIENFYERFSLMMNDFAERDFFCEKLMISNSNDIKYVNNKSRSHIGIGIFPFDNWDIENRKIDLIFDTIEFLYRFISKPGELGYLTDEDTGYNYEGYLSYDKEEGKKDFREEINILLRAFKQKYELQIDGMILFLGDDTVNFIHTTFPEYNIDNIDNEIRLAIKWWKNKDQNLDDKKQAILKLANVLEYLKRMELYLKY